MNKICRICLEEGVLSSIFEKNFNLSLCDMIEYCCGVKITVNDGLPEQICSNCVYKLGIAYHFKQTYESADIRLRQYLGLRYIEKSTDVAVMTDPIVPTHSTIIKKCKCKLIEQRKSSSNYKKKPESEKLRRGPKPKPKQQYSCYQCEKQFKCQAQLDMHVRTHTGDRPFICMYCPRRFTQKHNLTIHLRIHTGEKPFQCEVCSKRFCAQGNLQAHLKIHTGQRDHTCTLCSKSFITSSELTRHMNKHRGVKNFKCELCGSGYVHLRDYKIHKMKKHQITEMKPQIERFNDSIKNVAIDVGGNAPQIPLLHDKINHHNIQHLINDKPTNVVVAGQPEQNMINFNQKRAKGLSEGETHKCSTCGENFEYLKLLAEHYLCHNKI